MPLKLYEKNKILDACFDLFAKDGYSKTTTIMLADAAGISKALLFHHFKSKKKLYISVLERCFDKMSEEINEESLTEFDDFFEARGESGKDKIEYLRQHPDLSKLLFEAFHSTPDELKEEVFKFSIFIKSKYGAQTDAKDKLLRELFNEIPLREGVDSELAYELIDAAMAYFRKKIAAELTDEEKLLDSSYWDELFEKKKEFLKMIRYGITDEIR